jgi:phage tail sheath gpL-like
MAIVFNNVPTTTRTPGTYAEIDNSRALQGLVQNPHKALIIGQKTSTGTKAIETLQAMTSDGLADGYFGPGSLLARMVNKFKENNPNTELFAMAVSGGTTQASARINFSQALSHAAGGAASAGNQTVFMMINGRKVERVVTSGWSSIDIASDFATYISEQIDFPCTVSTVAASGVLILSALNSGLAGNYLDVRFNYYDNESYPTFFGDSVLVSNFEGGAGGPDLGDVWAVIQNEQFHYIAQPYIDAANLTEIETELGDRFKPLEDLQGHGFTAVRGTQASCTTLGNSRNNAHNTIIGAYDSPTDPAEWAAALAAVAGFNLNIDPARPLHGLKLKGILAPPTENRFTRAEREILLYDGIATYDTDASGNILIERCITTYQSNSLGTPDPSYLDIQTLATLGEIRFQFKTRMNNRFIVPRFKLADDTFPVQPGSKVAQPKTVKQEIVSLFTLMRDLGYIENLDEFIDNLVVERNATDRNRVDVLLPPDLINQFRVLAGLIQFIL